MPLTEEDRRDLFAAFAMLALIGKTHVPLASQDMTDIARKAFRMADVMFEEGGDEA